MLSVDVDTKSVLICENTPAVWFVAYKTKIRIRLGFLRTLLVELRLGMVSAEDSVFEAAVLAKFCRGGEVNRLVTNL